PFACEQQREGTCVSPSNAINSFVTYEPERTILLTLISAFDWVVDIGGNVGHQTKRFSNLVGATGRVHAAKAVQKRLHLWQPIFRYFRKPTSHLSDAVLEGLLSINGLRICYLAARLSEWPNNGPQALGLCLNSLNNPLKVQ